MPGIYNLHFGYPAAGYKVNAKFQCMGKGVSLCVAFTVNRKMEKQDLEADEC